MRISKASGPPQEVYSELADGLAEYVCRCGAHNVYACGEPRPMRCIGCGRFLPTTCTLSEVEQQIADSLAGEDTFTPAGDS